MAASPMRRVLGFLTMLVFAALLSACGGGGGGGGGGGSSTTTTPTLTSIAVTPANSSISVGLNEQLRATGTYSDGSTQDLSSSATWTSANTAVDTINASGMATAIAAGSSVVTATMSGVSGTTSLTVTAGAALRSIAITPGNPVIVKGQTQQFTATGTFSDGTTQNVTASATWASASTGVATINTAGLASGVAAGSSTISAQLNGITGSTTLGVTNAALQSIAVAPTNPSISVGQTAQLTATGTYSDASTRDITSSVTWASATPAVATVSAAGLVSGVAAGNALVSASLGSIASNAATVVVGAAPASQTFVYYSKLSSTPGTATLDANGNLKMDGLTLTGFVFGGGATDPSGTLKYWASPWNNMNQPVVQAMLFCTADNKLAYVLIQSAANDPNRRTETAANVMSAIEAAPQYDGMNVYTTCSGTFTNAWDNDLPKSDFFLWPDVFTSYSYSYVINEMAGAAIFHEIGTPSNQHNNLVITWPIAAPTFQVWQ